MSLARSGRFGREERLRALRFAGFDDEEAFAAWLVDFRGGVLVKTEGMTSSRVASEAGVPQGLVDQLMASAGFQRVLRQQLMRSVYAPWRQHALAESLVRKAAETTDLRQQVAGMRYLDEVAALQGSERDGPAELRVRFVMDEVSSPYEELEVVDAEFRSEGGGEDGAADAGAFALEGPGEAAGLREPEARQPRDGQRAGGAQAGEQGEVRGVVDLEAPAPAVSGAHGAVPGGWQPPRTLEVEVGEGSSVVGSAILGGSEVDRLRLAGLGGVEGADSEAEGAGLGGNEDDSA